MRHLKVFAILLVISSAIGVYFAWKDRQNDDENNYALAGQTFSAWPVSLRNDFHIHCHGHPYRACIFSVWIFLVKISDPKIHGSKKTKIKNLQSLTATSISAITMMGMPSEYYVFGSTVAWGLIAEFIGNFHICHQ